MVAEQGENKSNEVAPPSWDTASWGSRAEVSPPSGFGFGRLLWTPLLWPWPSGHNHQATCRLGVWENGEKWGGLLGSLWVLGVPSPTSVARNTDASHGTPSAMSRCSLPGFKLHWVQARKYGREKPVNLPWVPWYFKFWSSFQSACYLLLSRILQLLLYALRPVYGCAQWWRQGGTCSLHPTQDQNSVGIFWITCLVVCWVFI